MTNVINIRTKQTQGPGPKVPIAYVRQGRDEPRTHSTERPITEDEGLSEAAKDRLAKAGIILVGAAVAGGLLFGLSHVDKPVHHSNPAGVMTSGAESE